MSKRTYHKPSKVLSKKLFFRGKIKTLTGLYIGGSNTQMNIGGLDNMVIRNPFNDEPYIPGSSLKGKMRALLEQSYGQFGRGIGNSSYGPLDNPNHDIVKLFGNAKKEEKFQKKNIPSRLIVRDGKILSKGYSSKTELPFTELKTEVTIDRLTASATPRQLERVPAGVEFELQLVLNIWKDQREEDLTELSDKEDPITLPQEGQEEKMVQLVFAGLKLIQDDFLGGQGSRGSGQVTFGISEILQRDREFYLSSDRADGYQSTDIEIPHDLMLDW